MSTNWNKTGNEIGKLLTNISKAQNDYQRAKNVGKGCLIVPFIGLLGLILLILSISY